MLRNFMLHVVNKKFLIHSKKYSIVPLHVDYNEYLNLKSSLTKEIIIRQANNNLNKLENLWGVYEVLNNKNSELKLNQAKILKELEQVKRDNGDSIELKKLTIQYELLEENLLKLKSPLQSAKDSVMVELLKLPNRLHALTPIEKNCVIHINGVPASCNKNHIDVGKDLDFIHFTDNGGCYLLNDAAVFELEAKMYFSKLLNKENFIPLSITDFCKSFIVEGCCDDATNPHCTFLVEKSDQLNKDRQLHLVGGASIYSFLAYHSRNVIHKKYLPLKFFSIGRQYTPSISKEHTLFNVNQSTAIEIFLITKSLEDLDQVMKDLIKLIQDAYEGIGYHFRLSYVPAHKLKSWESLRLAIEMYSGTLKDYVEIGNLSVSGDFLSKHFMIYYIDGKDRQIPHIISGTILNVPKLLACVLEQDDKFSLPHQFIQLNK